MTKSDEPDGKFVRIYGPKALEGSGFTMIPNDLLDNFGQLDLTSSDKLVLLYMLRLNTVKSGAKKIAKNLGLSQGQVRTSYRKLDQKNLIKRYIEDEGGVNQFHIGGIVELVKGYAYARHAGRKIISRDAAENVERAVMNQDTNKEYKDLKENKDSAAVGDILNRPGYDSARAVAEELRKRSKK